MNTETRTTAGTPSRTRTTKSSRTPTARTRIKSSLTMPQNPPGLREFEVRFGDNARSERMPRPPSTKIIQVNVASGATRIVRRIASPRGSNRQP